MQTYYFGLPTIQFDNLDNLFFLVLYALGVAFAGLAIGVIALSRPTR